MSEERKVREFAKYEFNSKELAGVAAELSAKRQEKATIEDEKKSVASTYKAQIDGIDAKVNKLAANYSLGFEYRDIDCFLTLDDKRKERIYARCDTGAVVKTEPMREEDFQECMKFSEGEAVEGEAVEVEGELVAAGTE